MKKHKSIDDIALVKKLAKEIKQLNDIRFASIMFHAFIEYFVNELICLKFTNAKLIIDNNSFSKKFLILKALEIFGKLENKDKLDKNIEIITKIRNHYAHNLITVETVPESIKNFINQLTIFNYSSFKSVDTLSFKKTPKGYELRFYFCAISTIFYLHKIVMTIKDFNKFVDICKSEPMQNIQPKTRRQLSKKTSP